MDPRRVRRWRVEVTGGASAGASVSVGEGIVRVGGAEDNDLVLDDPKVSRRHLELEAAPAGLRVRDLGSKNGTFYQGSRVAHCELPPAGGVLVLGLSELTVLPDDEPFARPAYQRERCGPLLGRSALMRQLFARIERVAASPATVLIQGETGTGKELVAEALHELGPRRQGPFVVVDCGAIPRDLIESELFGHVRGAFTGATGDRRGAFERARGGTLFLDEIAELELALQPRLMRALEAGTVRPVGSDRDVPVDVRVIAATLRDLPREVQAKRFREDLYYRVAVVRLDVPPLRAREGDLPLLVDHFLRGFGAAPLGADALEVLAHHAWPGNVRQLRNVLERAAALAGGGPLVVDGPELEHPDARLSPATLRTLPYKDAKQKMLARFTRDYLEALLGRHGGNVSAAAREAQIDRNWIVALALRHGLRVRE